MHRGETGDVHFSWPVGVHLYLVLDNISAVAAGSQEISEGLVVDLDKRGLHVVLKVDTGERWRRILAINSSTFYRSGQYIIYGGGQTKCTVCLCVH